jgi:hypothetical protein
MLTSVLEMFFFFLHNSTYGYISGWVYNIKILYLVTIGMCLHNFVRLDFLSFENLIFHIRNYVLITSILTILPFAFDFDYKTYEGAQFATKGMFASGNALGVVLGVGSLISLYYFRIKSNFINFLSYLVISFALIMVGTKAASIFFLASVFSLLFYKRKLHSILISLFFLSSIILFYGSEILGAVSIVYDVVLLRFQNPSFIGFLLSSRDEFFDSALNEISFDGLYFLRFLFGFGAFLSYRTPGDIAYPYVDILESDALDVFFMYGLIALIFYIALILFFSLNFLKLRFYFIFFIFLLYILHSLIAGHVLFNGMSGIFLPCFVILLFAKSKKS